MISRRSCLKGLVALASTQVLSGCGEHSDKLSVLLLQGSIPPQLIGGFKEQLSQGHSLSFKPKAQLQDLFKLLEAWQPKNTKNGNWFARLPVIGTQSTPKADLVTLGDYWLAEAIKKQLIEPFNLEKISGWQQLPPQWQQIVKRNSQGNLDESGQIWGAPYRWGTTLIAYNQDKFKSLGWEPSDWQDLWREELGARLAMIDEPREVIGLTLKKMGYSYNIPALSAIKKELKSELFALQKQAKYYSLKYYLQPLILGDVWATVGWSSDILPLVTSNHNIKAVVPRSGTALWSDVWVQPKDSSLSQLSRQWIDFCWQTKTANQISWLSNGTSPILLNLKKNEILSDVKKNPLVLVEPKILEKCEFLHPLPLEVHNEYIALWTEMRERRH